jgi:hypothetical protein
LQLVIVDQLGQEVRGLCFYLVKEYLRVFLMARSYILVKQSVAYEVYDQKNDEENEDE